METSLLLATPDVEAIFSEFVARAIQEDMQSNGASPSPRAGANSVAASAETEIVIPLVSRKQPRPFDASTITSFDEVGVGSDSRPSPGQHTQRVQASKLVPDVAQVKAPEPPVPERSVDGQIPPRELDRMMSDMEVLLRYSHREDVGRQLDELLARYPSDLLLLRRVAEFHVRTGSTSLATNSLFRLAAGLFKRGNIMGTRQALDQVLILDPNNEQATRLLGLLEQRAVT